MLAKLKFKIEDILFKDKNFVEFENLPRIDFSQPPAHIDADLSSTWALSAAKIIKKAPLDIAKKAVKVISEMDEIDQVNITAPGFINIKLKDSYLVQAARDRRLKNRDINPNEVSTEKILIEFVSANPTGPLHLAIV